jgi:hypothetical protein
MNDSEGINVMHCRTTGAERMRRHRERRRSGRRCVTLELQRSEAAVSLKRGEILELNRRGYLRPADRGDTVAIENALHRFFEDVAAAKRLLILEDLPGAFETLGVKPRS